MNRFFHILLLILLSTSYKSFAQNVDQSDSISSLGFLSKHLKNQIYEIDTINQPRIHFLAKADFHKAKFDYPVYLQSSDFDSTAEFSFAKFDSLADFSWSQFDYLANFHSAKFHSRANFSSVQFDFRAGFFYTKFISNADFSNVKFRSRADFSKAQFNSKVDFFYTKFDSVADFSDAHFEEHVDFIGTTLPTVLIFQNVAPKLEIDLTKSRLGPNKNAERRFCFIDLRGAAVSRFHLYYDNFRIYWPEEIDRIEYERLSNVYEGLLKSFEDRGHRTSYNTLDKEYQAFKDQQNPDASIFKKLVNKINYYWDNYGYDKEFIWIWTIALFAISSLVNWLIFPYLIKEVYPIQMIDKALFKGEPVKRLEFRGSAVFGTNFRLNFKHITLAFFYTCLIFFGLKLSTERINFDKYRGVALIFTEYLIGLICLGYLANFIISSGLIGK